MSLKRKGDPKAAPIPNVCQDKAESSTFLAKLQASGFGVELVFVAGLGLMMFWTGQFRVAPRSCLHRPFVVRLFGFRAIAGVNSGLNAALLGGGACGGFFHDVLALISSKAARSGAAREGSGSEVIFINASFPATVPMRLTAFSHATAGRPQQSSFVKFDVRAVG
jgi:hypothetical protein